MSILKGIVKVLDGLNNIIGKGSSYLTLIFMLLVVYEVLSRRIFNSPTIWTYETIIMLFGAYIILTAGYGILVDALVSVDILSQKFPKKARECITLFSYVVLYIPFVGITLFKYVPTFIRSFVTKEVSWTVWGPVIWPIKLMLVIGLSLLLLQCLSQVIKTAYSLATGRKILEVETYD